MPGYFKDPNKAEPFEGHSAVFYGYHDPAADAVIRQQLLVLKAGVMWPHLKGHALTPQLLYKVVGEISEEQHVELCARYGDVRIKRFEACNVSNKYDRLIYHEHGSLSLGAEGQQFAAIVLPQDLIRRMDFYKTAELQFLLDVLLSLADVSDEIWVKGKNKKKKACWGHYWRVKASEPLQNAIERAVGVRPNFHPNDHDWYWPSNWRARTS